MTKASELEPGRVVTLDEAAELVYWYDSSNKTLNIFKPDELQQMIAEGMADEIKWGLGQTVAQVSAGSGVPPVSAQAITRRIEDSIPFWASMGIKVGDVRRLKYKRVRLPWGEKVGACSTDVLNLGDATPERTRSNRGSTRYHELLLGRGEEQAPETAENTYRIEYYATPDCTNGSIGRYDGLAKWVVLVRSWP